MIFPSLTSPKRSAWIHPGAIPEPSEAMGDSQSMILSLMASFKRSAGSHPGTTPEPSEAVGESQSMFFIVEDKLYVKRMEPSRIHPGAIGSRGRIAKYDFIAADKL